MNNKLKHLEFIQGVINRLATQIGPPNPASTSVPGAKLSDCVLAHSSSRATTPHVPSHIAVQNLV